MDHAAVQAWLDRYVAAWKSYDAAEIGDLFSDDAVYRYHPYDEGEAVERGRDAIVRSWVEPAGSASQRDEPGTYDARYEPWAVDGRRAVAVGTSTYWTDASRATIQDVFHNVYLLEFDAEGRCSAFTEWFMARPKRES
jgi:hypothetical protein